jgi:hypothetical protein
VNLGGAFEEVGMGNRVIGIYSYYTHLFYISQVFIDLHLMVD